MDAIKMFENKEYGKVNVIVVEGREFFEATRVAEILGYTNPRKAVRDHCLEEGKTLGQVIVTKGTKLDGSPLTQRVNKKFIDEANLYRLILSSKLKSARKFEKWVVSEVLPSIRKHRAYIKTEVLEEINTNPSVIRDLLLRLRQEEQKVRELNDLMYDNKHLIEVGKCVGVCEDAISIGAYSKLLNSLGINIGRNRLFCWFRINGYITKQGLENHPKQRYVDMGLFKTREFIINTSSGEKLVITTYITGKGQEYFMKIIGEELSYEKDYRKN